jgi:glycosyltransferase involved in cell wall biosynthesis
VIYICIPALDEARTIGILLWKIRGVMAEFPRDYEILVLDDGSGDDTPEVLAPYARVLPLTVLRHERTQGYAASLERLLREAVARSTHPRRDVVITLQADFTEAPEDVPALVKRMEGGADVVGGVAAVQGEEPGRGLRWSRKGLPLLLSRAGLPKEVRDPLTGFRAYRVSVLKRALAACDGKPLLTREGWAANAELLLAVAPHARRVEDTEVSVRYDRRDRESRFRPWSALTEMWHLRRTGRAPARAAPQGS